MNGAKSCRCRTDFVQICVRNISDFCSKSDSNLCNVSSASSPQKLLNCLRALPKMHIGFERKSTRFLSDFDQISVPNLIDLCFKSEPNLNFCEKSSEALKILGFPKTSGSEIDFYQICTIRFLIDSFTISALNLIDCFQSSILRVLSTSKNTAFSFENHMPLHMVFKQLSSFLSFSPSLGTSLSAR